MTDLLALELLVLLCLLGAARIPFLAMHRWKLLVGGIVGLQALALLLSDFSEEKNYRRPILGSRPAPAFEGDLSIRRSGHRILSVAGKPVESLADFEAALGGVPRGGVVPMRAMDPGPDRGVRTVLLWTALLDPGESLGASSLAALEDSRDPGGPRLALSAWGVVAPALGIARIPALVSSWSQVPGQYYALDVAPHRVPGYFMFRLASLLTSLAIALLLARGLARLLGRAEASLTLALTVTLLLEAASLFVFS